MASNEESWICDTCINGKECKRCNLRGVKQDLHICKCVFCSHIIETTFDNEISCKSCSSRVACSRCYAIGPAQDLHLCTCRGCNKQISINHLDNTEYFKCTDCISTHLCPYTKVSGQANKAHLCICPSCKIKSIKFFGTCSTKCFHCQRRKQSIYYEVRGL